MAREGEQNRDWNTYELARRAVLKATSGAAALSLGAGTATAATGGGGRPTDMHASSEIDPIFGQPSTDPVPSDINTVVDMEIDFEGLVFAATQAETPSLDAHIPRVNEAAADGTVTEKEATQLKKTITLPDGSSVPLSAVASALTDTLAFHYHPTGIAVEPGTVVAFNAAAPDHGVAAYHQGHGRQNRVPDGVGPFSSPLVPVGGHWLYEFTESGVYDVYCPPHEAFGMVGRVVVTDDSTAPAPSVENTGRPPTDANELSLVFGGFDPNLPSAAEALATEALSPQNIVDNGTVDWHEVVDEHRSG